MRYDLIILGAGPAGLAAAAAAARTDKKARILILNKAEKPGVKLLLAGGGKGNVTNRRVGTGDYVGENPAFAEYALGRVTPETVCRELTRAGIPLEEREHGRIFCAKSARATLDFLLAQLPPDRCHLRSATAVTGMTVGNDLFSLARGTESFSAPRCVMATGSPAWPQCGADDSGLLLARSLGHRIVPPRPVLVPLVMPPDWPLTGLSGVSLPVRISCGVPDSPAFHDSLLFTHKGVSGPAALQVSCWWRKGSALTIDFLPGADLSALLDAASGKATPKSVLSRLLPGRLAAALLNPDLADRRIAELSRKQRSALSDAVHGHGVIPLRTEGAAKAEAAAGGVDVADIDPFTMQSRRVPGLFFCGEMLDITGRLGGYNLHWAWASGAVAGEAAVLGRHG